jgi:hypothetical protein
MIRGDSNYSNASTPQAPSVPVASVKDVPQFNQRFDLVCGFLRKRTNGPNKSWLHLSWSKRWFWIDLDIPEKGNYTLCYADRESKLILKPKRVFHLVGAQVVVHNSRTFSLHFPNSVLTLQCASPQECYRWTASLAHIIAVADIRAEALYKLKSTADVDLVSHFFNKSNEDVVSLSTSAFSELGSLQSVPSESQEDADGSRRGDSEDVTVSLWGDVAPQCSLHVHHRRRPPSPLPMSLHDDESNAVGPESPPMPENAHDFVDNAASTVHAAAVSLPARVTEPSFLTRAVHTSLYTAEVVVASLTWSAIVISLVASAFCLAACSFVTDVVLSLKRHRSPTQRQ